MIEQKGPTTQTKKLPLHRQEQENAFMNITKQNYLKSWKHQLFNTSLKHDTTDDYYQTIITLYAPIAIITEWNNVNI